MRLFTAAIALTLVSSAAPVAQKPQPQQPAATFKSSVTLVTIDVSVLDSEGRPVPGLTADDFQIKLNGRLQPVRALNYVQVAKAAAPLTVTDIAPEVTGRKVVTNSAPAGETKVFVLMLDDLSFSSGSGRSMIEAAKRFVDRQPADAYVGVTTTSGSPVVNPTLEREPVKKALSRIVGSFVDPRRPLTPTAPTVGIAEALDVIDHNDAGALSRMVARECGTPGAVSGTIVAADNRCANDAVSTARMIASQTRGTTARQVAAVGGAVSAMKGAKGLKQLVLMSEGIGATRDVMSTFEPLARAAAEAGVQLSILVEEGRDLDLSDAGRAANSATEDGTRASDTGLSNRRREDFRMFKASMQTLADVTGGTFETVIGDADRAFNRAAVAGSALYRIGVEPPVENSLKPFSVSASVRKPGLTVQANRQAVLPGPVAEPTTSERVKAAINEGQPLFSVPIRLAVAMRRASAGQVELGVGMEVPSSVAGPLTMTFGLVDQAGGLKSGSRPLELPADHSNYRLTFPLPVAPGKYTLRFAVTDATGAVGSVETSLEAKLMPMGELTASDVLTWWTDSAGKAQFLALDRVPPGVSALGAGIELYPAGAAFPANVKVTTSLVPKGGANAVVEKEVTPLMASDMMRAEASLPLAGVPAGDYVLRATVTVAGVKIGEATAIIKKS